jgi:protein-disulfide isomerase
MIWTGFTAAGAVVLAGLLAWPSIKPIGEIATAVPYQRPMVNGLALGPEEAPVLVEEYADFQCSSCRLFAEGAEREFVNALIPGGKVRLVYRHFTILGRDSVQAANASLCASEQGKFWEYHDILFANQIGTGAYSDRRLSAYASAIGLDLDKFETCYRDSKYQNLIDQDNAAASAAGLTGTPSILVNGKQIAPGYVPTFDVLKQEIDLALQGAEGTP